MVAAQKFAAAGAVLLGVFYVVTNGVPLLENLGAVPASALARFAGTLLLPPLLWAWFFLKPQPRSALAMLLAGVAPQTLESWVRVWPTFSVFSLDSIFYFFTDAVQPLAYAWFLAAVFRDASVRRAAYVLSVVAALQALAVLAEAAWRSPERRGRWCRPGARVPSGPFGRCSPGPPS